MRRAVPYLVSAGVLSVLAWYYFIYRGFPVNLSFINAVIAFGSTIILALALSLGPTARLIRKTRHSLRHRKVLGLIGFSLAALHALLAAALVLRRGDAISFSDATSLVFAGLAFMVFSLMALTSTRSWVRQLGYHNWKSLQRTGYAALVFVLAHVALLGQGVYLNRIIGQIAISFILLVLLLRGLVIVLRVPRRRVRTASTPAGGGTSSTNDAAESGRQS